MRSHKTIKTTLGDLIVAVTDQVKPHIPDPTAVYLVVECILSDLVASERLRFNPQLERGSRVYH
jgi:hypothetical protein